MPREEPLDWRAIFGRAGAPRVLDLGCGNGRYLIGSAVWRPDFDHLGVDLLPLVIRYATRRANQRGLTNIRFAVVGARELLERYIEPGSVAEIHCYLPQPYHDPGQAHRRLLTPEFLALARRSLKLEGRLYFQTDHAGYWSYLRQVMTAFFELHEQPRPWPDAPKGRTRREIIALRRGLPVYRGWACPRPGIDAEAAMRLAHDLPRPVFGADHRSRALDRYELGHRRGRWS